MPRGGGGRSPRAETRITGGAWRGRLVSVPPGHTVRPTTSLVRQALFDIVGARVVGARVVDLFAGAGTIGFEALSRGAAHVVAVERDRVAASAMAATAERLGAGRRLRVVPMEVVRWLDAAPPDLAAATLVVLDAPYRDDVVVDVLERCGRRPLPLLVCEHHRARELPETTGHLRRLRTSRYGQTQLSFYAAGTEPAAGIPASDEEASNP